jgi:septal ring factor EnvC (AmiA/AmiB activator)
VLSLKAQEKMDAMWAAEKKESLQRSVVDAKRDQLQAVKDIARLDAQKQSLEMETEMLRLKLERAIAREEKMGHGAPKQTLRGRDSKKTKRRTAAFYC